MTKKKEIDLNLNHPGHLIIYIVGVITVSIVVTLSVLKISSYFI